MLIGWLCSALIGRSHSLFLEYLYFFRFRKHNILISKAFEFSKFLKELSRDLLKGSMSQTHESESIVQVSLTVGAGVFLC